MIGSVTKIFPFLTGLLGGRKEPAAAPQDAKAATVQPRDKVDVTTKSLSEKGASATAQETGGLLSRQQVSLGLNPGFEERGV